ncbi:hypothetical protein J7K76_04705 [Candidatus Bipolaricaulota bacterium]|nr:hypothetical protein [Candidatus Bipolaricaulota bacterium]
MLSLMYEGFHGDADWKRLSAVLVILSIVGGLAFLYLWLNAKAILVQRQVSEMALEVKRLETELLGLEYRVEAALSPEALLQLVKELNEKAKEAGEPLLVPLKKEQIIPIPGDVERGND